MRNLLALRTLNSLLAKKLGEGGQPMIPHVNAETSKLDRRETDFLSSYQETVRQWIDQSVAAQETVSKIAFGNVGPSTSGVFEVRSSGSDAPKP
jgi:hypothetical protein